MQHETAIVDDPELSAGIRSFGVLQQEQETWLMVTPGAVANQLPQRQEK